MSQRPKSVPGPWRRRLRGLAVLAVAGGMALPLLVATGSARGSDPADAVVALARLQVGAPYVWAAVGPDAFDCSGLTSYVWREAGGVVLPRVSRDQQRFAVAIPREQLLPGDLVFYSEPVDHVALYVGDGRVVDASSAKRGVLERGLWTATVTRYGRVPRPGMPAVLPWTPPPPPVTPAAAPVAVEPTREPGQVAPTPAPSLSASTPSPAPTPPRAAAARPTPVPSRTPVAVPTTSAPPARPAPAAARPSASPVVRVLADLPATQTSPSSATALAAVARAQATLGLRGVSDVGFVQKTWRDAGGVLLAGDRSSLVNRGLQVSRPQIRVGDLVAYGSPASQVYLYAGKGYMVGYSAQHGAVVVRRVHTGDVRFLRLPG